MGSSEEVQGPGSTGDELEAATLFGKSRQVKLVHAAGTPEETCRQTHVGGDLDKTALVLPQYAPVTWDEIHSDALDEPRVVAKVDPIVVDYGLCYWTAVLVARSEWNKKHLERGLEPSQLREVRKPYPRQLYHATLPPVTVTSVQEEASFGRGWSRDYIPQSYPKMKHHWDGRSLQVKNIDEELALGGGWGSTPAAFQQFRAPTHRQPSLDATKWVADWELSGLSEADRSLIRAQLLRADASFWSNPNTESACRDTMRLAFRGIARVLFERRLLTGEILEGALTQLVWNSAIAGGWWRYAAEFPMSIFPQRLGHYWVWRDANVDWAGLFDSEISECRADLLEMMAVSGQKAVPAPLNPTRLFRRSGDVWQIKFDGKSAAVKHLTGMEYVLLLLQAPGQSLHSLKLRTADSGTADQPAIGSAGDVLDETALKQYSSRLDELDLDLEKAERDNDQGRKESAQIEKEKLLEQLSAATGLGGRPRRAADDAERLRKSVSMAISRAIKAIGKHDAELADHLKLHIKCGNSFCYEPDSIPWTF